MRELQRYADAGWGGVHIIPIYGAKGWEDRAIPYLTPSRELAADCQAARMLAARGDREAILAGAAMMGGMGPFPTGAHYPTGTQRAATIRRCGGLR